MEKSIINTIIICIILVTISIMYYFLWVRPQYESSLLKLQKQKIDSELQENNNQFDACISRAKDIYMNSFYILCTSDKMTGCDKGTFEDREEYSKYVQSIDLKDAYAQVYSIYQKDVDDCFVKYKKNERF